MNKKLLPKLQVTKGLKLTQLDENSIVAHLEEQMDLRDKLIEARVSKMLKRG